MKIPRKIKIGGVEYTVRLMDLVHNGEAFGYWDPKGYIDIQAANIPQSVINQAFVHECVHAILGAMQHELNENESFVNTFASFLHEVIDQIEG